MQPKKFNLKMVSKNQSREHLKLYEGYCKKIDEIRKKISSSSEEGNSTYSEIRGLKIEEGFCINAVKLHELYFENIGNGKAEEVKKIIENDFGSFSKWEKDFINSALSARGWVVLAYDWIDRKLHNYVCDMHHQGGIWQVIPILVLDMYEHAYFIDFGTEKKKYIELFLKNINWEIVEERLKWKEI
jgi:superoxide dismutase, Fe-Mn family